MVDVSVATHVYEEYCSGKGGEPQTPADTGVTATANSGDEKTVGSGASGGLATVTVTASESSSAGVAHKMPWLLLSYSLVRKKYPTPY